MGDAADREDVARTDSEPVIATDWSTGISSSAEMTAVATVMEAESPSTPCWPAWTNWMWMSFSERSTSENFLMIAETFWTDLGHLFEFAGGDHRAASCAGAISAMTGSIIPLSSPMTASPLTRPSTPSSVTCSS